MKKKLISFFKKNPNRLFKNKEIAKRLRIAEGHEYDAMKAALFKLYEEDFLSRSGKRYKLNILPKDHKITGTLQINQGGYGFVIPEKKDTGDIFIAARNLNTAFSGDKVEVILFAKQKRKNLEGQIINIIKRKREEIVGTLRKSKSFYFVKPDEPELHRDIYVDASNLKGAKKGDKVSVGSLVWDSSMLNPEGEIIEIIGESGSKEAEGFAIAREFNLPYRFPESVLNEAEEISTEIPEDEIKKRIDFRDKNVFTIDPEDAKDFDDALSIEELENGNLEIGIHIADVSHYVDRGKPLDKQALKRSNSVYLVGQVIPMLPEKLSNVLCSLVPYKDRLTYSVIVEITKRGKLIKYDIQKTIINSKRRFTYEEAQQVIETEQGDLANEIIALNNLARILRKKRFKEGGIEFSTPEIRFILDEDGSPVEIYKKELKESNKLIEEYMLLANKIVAKHIGFPVKSARPFIYRVHDLPDTEKIYEFARFVKSLGYSFEPNAASQTKQFMSLIEQVRGKEEEALVNELAIRSMAKAEYSINNIGHYGLGFKYYTHFTSPIRRYADLLVHRLLFDYTVSKKKVSYGIQDLDEISEHISQSERSAIDAERLSVKLKQIEYLKDHIGEEFHAVISGITHFGIFVKITNILAEGLIRLRDLEGDFYVYDDKKYALIGKATRKQFRLGDKITVKLVRVDYDKSELDFIIPE